MEQKPIVLKPGDENNAYEQNKKTLEELYFLLEQRGVNRPKDLTEYEFLTRTNALQKHGTSNAPELG